MYGTPTRSAASFSSEACRRADSRFSMTHGPAITAKGRPAPISKFPTPTSFIVPISNRQRSLRAHDFHARDFGEGVPFFRRCLDKTPEERMTIHWTRLKFRMKLTTEEPPLAF